MAPVNGTAGKPPKTMARLPNKPIIPVLPLNFPQRPAAKKQPSAPADSSVTEKAANGVRPAEDKAEPHAATPSQEKPNGTSTKADSNNSMDHFGQNTRFGARFQGAASAGLASGAGVPDERNREVPTMPSTLPDRRMSAQGRPPGFPNPAPAPMGPSGPIPEGHVPVSHRPDVHAAALHQPHPSSGGIPPSSGVMMFGGFHDSNASSPAPRSAGGFPPPGLQHYPPPPVDIFGRPLHVSPTGDGFPQNLINPQGSQSSVQAEEHGFGHYPTGAGAPAGQGLMPPPGMNLPMPGALHHGPGPVPAPGYQGLRDQDEALAFLRQGVFDNSFYDCVLQVRFADNPEFQDHPGYQQHLSLISKSNAHRFILSRSPMLAGVMRAQATAPGAIICIDAIGDFLRPDVFWHSFRTLYGWSFADGVLPSDLQHRGVRDEMKTALSYVATARYLQLPWVYSVAVHCANRLLCWDTIETAARFVSRIVDLSRPNDGLGIRELLEGVVTFIIDNFPVDFVLDATVGDPGLSRFPPYSPLPPGGLVPSSTPANPNFPPVANGTSGGAHSRRSSQAQISRNPRVSSNLRLSQIKFGDISPPDLEPAGMRAPNATDSVLSRILLHLPFPLLKQILEHPNLGKLSGEFKVTSRLSMVTSIIVERELRRQRVMDSADPRLSAYHLRVQSAAAPVVVENMDDVWVNNMGFKEEVFPGDLPYIVHTWSTAASAAANANN